MRLLWLTPELPDLEGAGGGVRAHHLITRLAERGTQVTLVAPAHREQAARAARSIGGAADLQLVSRPQGHVHEALRAAAARPALLGDLVSLPWLGWQAEVFWTAMAARVRAVLASGRFDAVVVEHDFAMAWANRVPASLPAGLMLHNTTWQMLAEQAAAADGVRRAAATAEAARFRRHVRRHASRYGWACAVSADDAAEASARLGRSVAVVPNGADTARLAAVPAGPGTCGSLFFAGTLSYPPNAEAAEWIVREALGPIQAACPAAHLTIAGRGAPPSVLALASVPGVEVAGWVPDIAAALADAAVVVVPLQSGGGTKLKVLEALAAGRPVVTTSVGAAGIDVVSGEHLLVADGVAAFAEAVAGLLADPEAAGRLGARGRAFAAAHFDWRAIGDRLHDELSSWLSRAGPCTSA